MYDVKDDPMETIHVYVMREGQLRPSLVPLIFPIVTLFFFIALAAVIPSHQPEQYASIKIPAVFLPLKTWSVTEPVIATGVKTYPATPAHGILTITNGSVIAQELPAGLIFTGADSVEVMTDSAVFVPAGSASGYGLAYVSAHTMISGKTGNIADLDVDSVEGGSVYIRNLSSFTGGKNATKVKFVTQEDRQTALAAARVYLTAQVTWVKAILEHPCSESASFGKMLRVTWVCRFAAYPELPGFHVTGVRIAGRTLLVDVIFAARYGPFPGK